ncbi:MAG: HEPN domain-containing protein [Chloroflexi bacterium]|nr:HEPN domain-containing protein [Chloroflexota bacterium]
MKAYLILRTGRSPQGIHSIQKLAAKCLDFDPKFEEAVELGRTLDRYYVPTRYPDALTPPAVPFETFTRKDAEEAIKKSRDLIAFVRGEFEAGAG